MPESVALSRALLDVLDQVPAKVLAVALTRVAQETAAVVRDALAGEQKKALVSKLADIVESTTPDVNVRRRAVWLLKDLCDRECWPTLRRVILRRGDPDALVAEALETVERLLFGGQVSAREIASLHPGVAGRKSHEIGASWARLLGTLVRQDEDEWALNELRLLCDHARPVGEMALRALAGAPGDRAEKMLRDYQAVNPSSALAGELILERMLLSDVEAAKRALAEERPIEIGLLKTLAAGRQFGVLARVLKQKLVSAAGAGFLAAMEQPPDLSPSQGKLFRQVKDAAQNLPDE